PFRSQAVGRSAHLWAHPIVSCRPSNSDILSACDPSLCIKIDHSKCPQTDVEQSFSGQTYSMRGAMEFLEVRTKQVRFASAILPWMRADLRHRIQGSIMSVFTRGKQMRQLLTPCS